MELIVVLDLRLQVVDGLQLTSRASGVLIILEDLLIKFLLLFLIFELLFELFDGVLVPGPDPFLFDLGFQNRLGQFFVDVFKLESELVVGVF